ncbi:putative ribonuclease H-like domain-containing protein [Tanacetum coccineum]|uniref:Ribonuclease H-like domain-containing protein n=1 Tax=Tanacetum coccineum TaxID=301880 RepID=A0ABQ5D356_9ASTR
MSTSNTSTNSNQQTLADSGANKRPPILEKENCIPWESRFRRFLDNKLEDGERMWNSIQNGPYQRPMVVDPTNPTVPILESLSKMTEGNKKQYIADVRVMNYLLRTIPNDIYNSVYACKNAKEMWERIKRLMHGSKITTHVKHSRLMDEFDKFEAKEGESLDSVHERLTTLVNIMDRNNVRPIPMAINTKFLNCLQPEWSKYVTMVCHNQTGPAVSYDVLYDQLVQFEPHVLTSRAKKATKNHDPLVLIAHSNASSSHSHANSSYSTQPYYVTHPPPVVDYDDEYQGELQGDSQEDKLTTAMIYGGNANKNAWRNITQGFNAGDESNQIIQRVPRTESTPGKANVQCYNCNEKGHYARECQKPKVHDSKYFREQMLLAMKDEAGSNLSNEENDFMLDTSYGEELEELTVAVMLMARLQPANENAETIPSYDTKAVSQVHASSKVHEQVSQGKRKTIIQTMDDDQIDSNIIFDDPFVENNGGTSEHDSTAHDEYREIQMLAYNVQCEAENQKRLNNELKKQKDFLQRELETFKDRVKTFESTAIQYSTYKETCDELEQKKAFKEREDRYLDDILDLEEKLSSHDRIVYKMGQSIQTIHMLGKRPNKVYDPFLKAGLGYTNPERLKKAIVAQPKMYDGDLLHSNKLVIHSTDSEETLEDAEESRNKIRHKMVQIDYEKLNALYETFVPQQELSAEQTYFSIPSTSDNGSKSKDVPLESPGLKMPTESRLLTMIDTLGDTLIGFQTRINKTFLQDTERRWLSDSQNELREFYKTDVISMSRSLYKTLSEIKEELIEEVHEVLNIFVSMEQKINDNSPTENILKDESDELLEVSLTSEIRNCMLLSAEQQKHEFLKVELEESASDSRDIQANLLKRIKILENDFQRSQAQSVDFELKLQHQKEKMDCDVSWKAKLSTLHDENVLLKHQVESTVKERENIKLEFQKLFNSIKATWAQHQNEINEMFEDVTQKTYAYADVHAQNQDLLMTISKLKNKLKTIDKGKHVNTKFDKSETLGQLLCVTPFNTNLAIKAKNVSNT